MGPRRKGSGLSAVEGGRKTGPEEDERGGGRGGRDQTRQSSPKENFLSLT